MTDAEKAELGMTVAGIIEGKNAEIERLRAALEKVRYKAGSHTVDATCVARGEADHGFAGIYAVADNALAKSV